jgi:hypothetical protein
MANDYTFEVMLRAVIYVRGDNEKLARKVVPSVLAVPSSADIGLANENNAAIGNPSVVTKVDLYQESAPNRIKRVEKPTAA